MSNETVSGLSDDVGDEFGVLETDGFEVVVFARAHTHMQRIRIQQLCSIFSQIVVSGLTIILDMLITHSV
jgi:formylmethanofuran dehydrogenase subunit D